MNESTDNKSETSFDSILDQFNTINDCLTLFKMQINTLQQKVKNVEKSVRKELKVIKKQNKNFKTKQKRAPSGFAKPTKVTNALCEFMDRPEGTEIARTEVTKALINYIKSNNLLEQGNNSKQKIVPDSKLKNLLGIDDYETAELTYFNIQKYMNKHFISNKNNSDNMIKNNL